MSQPILPWNSEIETHEKLVWRAKMDGRYLIEVERTSSHGATLRMFDHQKQDVEIKSEEVSLAYGAVFGPDVSDVAEWQDKCADFIDNEYTP